MSTQPSARNDSAADGPERVTVRLYGDDQTTLEALVDGPFENQSEAIREGLRQLAAAELEDGDPDG
ncbi:hypothetical protein A6E15_19225 [Natrinema saccharevitans]|uniref:CopG family transcriptional regulator n=1 Tax=Natrinema saccharevitans TaxID=301967 RepID=A0A1S8AR38_9EURY|nr:hypothetical protein [Natrinema saccharevitans]OLZ39097.1 hypothetical protein A6E15_19225 [Natrinema saccharevitans]